MNKIYVILVNFNQSKLTIDCIESIRSSSVKIEKIIVVDNASNDNSMERLRKIPDIELLESTENLGFSAGNNIGIKYALSHNATHIMLLNNDTVIHGDMIKILLEHSDCRTVVVPKIYYYPVNSNKIWCAGGELRKFLTDSRQYGLDQEDTGQYDTEKKVSFCNGCCFMMKAEIVKKVGLLDENYFMYCEDNDYSIRLANHNIDIKYIPKAIMWHRVSASVTGSPSKFIAYYVIRNRMYCVRKNNLGIHAFLFVIYESFKYWFISRFRKNKSYGIALCALIDGIHKKTGKTVRNLN